MSALSRIANFVIPLDLDGVSAAACKEEDTLRKDVSGRETVRLGVGWT